MKCLLKFDDAVHSDEAVLSRDAVRCRSRAVGHCDSRTARRSGSTAIAALFHEAVPDFAAWKGIGRIYLRALRSFDRRNRIFFIGQSALSKLLRKTPWHHYLLSCWEPFWCAGRRFSRLAKDGARKNDCEAATRLLEDVRREHPHLKLVEDGLALPVPHKSFAGLRPADSLRCRHGDSESGRAKPSRRFCAFAAVAGERSLRSSQRGRESRSVRVWAWPPAASELPEGVGGA